MASFTSSIAVDLRQRTERLSKDFTNGVGYADHWHTSSRGRVEIAVNQGNFSRVHKITPPVSVFIARKKG
jgi:S-adenosylmethionine hydrolase